MALIRRSLSRRGAKLFAVLCVVGWLILVLFLAARNETLFLTLFGVAGIPVIAGARQYFIHARDMFIEVTTDQISWCSPFADPQSICIPTADLEEIVILERGDDFEPYVQIKTKAGHKYQIPQISGSIFPIIRAIRIAAPNLKSSTGAATEPTLKQCWHFLRHGPPVEDGTQSSNPPNHEQARGR